MNELNTTIYSKLQGTALTSLLAGTTSIYHLQAPDNADPPYVVFNTQAGGDENQTPKRRKSLLLFVRGYSKVSAAQAGSIDAQIDTLLHRQSLSVSGWANIYTWRETDLETIQNLPSGEKYWMQGGFYRVRLERSS